MSDNGQSFIFHDPSGKRWPRFISFLRSIGLLLLFALVLVVLVTWTGPHLPGIGLPAVAPLPDFNEVPSIIRGQTVEKNEPFRIQKPAKPVRYVHSQSPVLRPRPAAKPTAANPLVWGFYVNWDRASMVSLRLHLRNMTHLVPEWLVLQNDKGDLDDQSDTTAITIAQQAKLPIIAMLTNFRDGWKPADVRKILNDRHRRENLIDNISANLKEHKFQGICVDFEELKDKDRKALVTFETELAARMHKEGYLVAEAVPVDDTAYDLRALASVNDYLVPMVYDEHYQSGAPGPVASENFFLEQIEKVAKQVSPEKIIAGIGNYGYDWVIGNTGGAETSFDDVMAAAALSGAPVEWDAGTENPVLRYTQAGQQHEIWFLDAVTALNQVIDTHDAGFRGVAVWRLGAEDPGLWKVLADGKWPAENFAVQPLAELAANQQSPRHYGTGEFLQVTQTPHGGSRRIDTPQTEQDNYRETYKGYPSPYVVSHSGSSKEKLLCLTFDDGPDPKYTGRILDALRETKTPATFFIVGVNAEENPTLIQREYREGHAIGNHTYTHPNIALTSQRRTELELGTTQRILENLLGVSTALFRPPYNADSEPVTPEEIEPIRRAQALGYTTVSETIDPRDWAPGITAEAILDDIDSELGTDAAENTNAHIILLHDAGGNREATIAALPQIIERYTKLGYRFGTVGELIGKTRAQVMPVPPAEELRMAQVEGKALDSKARFQQALGILFLLAIYLTVARSGIYSVLALLQKRQAARRVYEPGFQPPVTVVIAAYNEETVITRTVESVLSNGYPELEIIVVDDGSKDGTLRVLREAFDNHPAVTVLTQLNGGKSAALNNAISHASHGILIAVDADTLFRKGTIEKLVRHFCDRRVGAVSGNARVGNRNRWITRFQAIEYIYGFNLDRRALDLLNAITVVPGAVGAWRKDLVLQAGGFGHDTLAEDADLTMTIRRMNYKIRYEQDAIAYTEAPEDNASLSKQRFRWAYGTLQAAWKHRDAMFAPRYGTLGFVALPSIWLFQVLLSALSPFAEVSMVISLFAGNWRTVLTYYFAFFFLELLTGFLAYFLEGEQPWDLALLFFQRIYYRQLMLFVLFKSLAFAVRGQLVGWGKLERKASVTQP